ncbi:MAG: YihY/virulence factor BrkB family protein [Burkholderiaceae bacterium]
MTLRDLAQLARAAALAWRDDYAPSMGAALAYYALFSLSPLLLIALAVAGLLFPAQVENGVIASGLIGLTGAAGAQALQSLLEAAREPASSALAASAGAVLLLFGAMTVYTEVQSALDRIWRVPEAPGRRGAWHLLRARLGAFAMICATGGLLFAWLIGGTLLAAHAEAHGVPALVQHGVEMGLGFMVVWLLFALLYKIVPRVRIAWRDVLVGALATALLFSLGKFLIAWYIGHSGVTSAFGAAGSLAALMLWLYYSAQIFLLGAEFTWVYAHRFGSRRAIAAGGPTAAATPAAP